MIELNLETQTKMFDSAYINVRAIKEMLVDNNSVYNVFTDEQKEEIVKGILSSCILLKSLPALQDRDFSEIDNSITICENYLNSL